MTEEKNKVTEDNLAVNFCHENFAKEPFEFFYLKELFAEGIITKDLFDMTYAQLKRELEKTNEGEEVER